MFYSQFILAKKGPLGTIWIAAHLERKLRKNQVADTDIGVSVDSILSPEVPIALRLSSHLLLGVVRIYNRKVNYLFDDCSEALLKIKQAFRSTAVDLPPEESKAPYHSITLPETFDLDDFELPDSDILQGNYVDHHISSRDQITLQDTMEGVSYSTSKFGLDERFGDGDTSVLDLEEELFLDKNGTAGHIDESINARASFGSMSPLKQDEHPEDMAANSEHRVDDDDDGYDLVDYAQAPRTPGLMEEPPNLSNVQDALACDDHVEPENHLMVSEIKEISRDIPDEDKEAAPLGPPPEVGYLSSEFKINESKPVGESPARTHLLGGAEATEQDSELSNKTIEAFDTKYQEGSPTQALKEDMACSPHVNGTHSNNQGPKELGLEESALEISGLISSDVQSSEGVLAKDLAPRDDGFPGSFEQSGSQLRSSHDETLLGYQVGSLVEASGTQAGEGTTITLDLNVDDKEAANEGFVLWPCNSTLEQLDMTKQVLNMSGDVGSDTPFAAFRSEETLKLGEASYATGNLEQNLNEHQVAHALGDDIRVSTAEADGEVLDANSPNRLVNNLDKFTQQELPAPEKLLSVPEAHMDIHRDLLAEVSPMGIERLAEVDAGSKSVAGRKRSFTESTLTEQSLLSVESSRQVRVKRTVESVPDDDDLLSSILVGRRSSVLKVKPSPPIFEVTSMKRNRSASRAGAPKRKLLMDDTMVLHGDKIRKQLTNTEDIRRVRKKAPCTLQEISMIQKQHMEDEIFLGTLFTGMSAELSSLYDQVYDFSQIRVCQNNATDVSLEIMNKLGMPSQNDVYPDTGAEPDLSSKDNKHEGSIETVPVLPASPKNQNIDIEVDRSLDKTDEIEQSGQGVKSENFIGRDEVDRSLDKTDEIEQSGQGVNSEIFIVRDNDTVVPARSPLPTETGPEEVNHERVVVDINQDQSNPSDDVEPGGLQQEFLVNVDGGANPAVITVVEPLDLTEHATGNMDPSTVPGHKSPVDLVDFDYAGAEDGQSTARTEVTKEDGGAKEETGNELGTRDGFPLDMNHESVAMEMALDASHGELGYNVHTENYHMTYEEHREMEYPYPSAGVSMMEDVDRPDNMEAYPPNMEDAELSGFAMHDRDELNYWAPENDTDFLNVDDDDLTDIADEDIPNTEEKQYADSSGWSSRTRAVSKYLQAAFIKEAEYGKISLSMDNLLNGKSRKEASRMFFETLVLKTRDYIHVEQNSSFGDITIKPRTRLLRSDF